MNILMVSDYLTDDMKGGSDTMLLEHSRGLKNRGHFLKIIAGSGKQHLCRTHIIEGVEICRYKVNDNRFLRFFQTLLGSKKLFDRLNREIEFDIINFYQPLSAFYILMRAGKIKNIYKTCNFLSPWHSEYEVEIGPDHNIVHKINSILRRKIEKFCLERCDKIITMSEHMKKELVKIHSINEDKIVAIPGGVDTENFKPVLSKVEARRKLSLPPDKTIILSIACLRKRKGLSELILAMRPIFEKRNSIILVIVGDGPQKKVLEYLIKKLNLTSDVFMTGFKEKETLSLYYQAADLFVMPSQSLEAFGLVVVEALSSGIPILATPVGGIIEILSDFDKRCLFNGTSSASLREGIERFLSEGGTAQTMGERARNYAVRKYSWEVIMSRLEKEFMGRKVNL